jgi:hypothetical protein
MKPYPEMDEVYDWMTWADWDHKKFLNQPWIVLEYPKDLIASSKNSGIRLLKENYTSKIELKRYDPKVIFDMFHLFQDHHMDNENLIGIYLIPI